MVMLQWGLVSSFVNFPQRLRGLVLHTDRTPSLPTAAVSFNKATRVYALNPGVLEKIEEMRIKRKKLEDAVDKDTLESSLSREELVEKLREMRTIIEAVDSLTVIQNDMKVIEEDTKSGKNSEIQISARKVYQEFVECKELIEQQLNLVVDVDEDIIPVPITTTE